MAAIVVEKTVVRTQGGTGTVTFQLGIKLAGNPGGSQTVTVALQENVFPGTVDLKESGGSPTVPPSFDPVALNFTEFTYNTYQYVDVICQENAVYGLLESEITLTSPSEDDVVVPLQVYPDDTTICTTLTELFDALGYWDDSESEWVDGTVSESDWVVADFSGTQDRGGTDNILNLPPDIRLTGPGKTNLTIQCRLGSRGTASQSKVLWIEGLKFDAAGKGDIGSGKSLNYSATSFNLDGVNLVADQCDFSDSSPAGSNTLTLSNNNTLPVVCVLYECSGTGSGADLFSTKLASATGNNLLWVFNNDLDTPATGNTNQTLTPHDGWKAYVVRGDYEKLSASSNNQGQSLARGTETGTELHCWSLKTIGAIANADSVHGCKVSEGYVGNAGSGIHEFVQVENTDNVGSQNNTGIYRFFANTTTVAQNIAIDGPASPSGSSVYGLDCVSPSSPIDLTISNVSIAGVNRGFDARGIVAGFLIRSISNVIDQATTFGLLTESFATYGDYWPQSVNNYRSEAGWVQIDENDSMCSNCEEGATISAEDLAANRGWLIRDSGTVFTEFDQSFWASEFGYTVPEPNIAQKRIDLLRQGGWISGEIEDNIPAHRRAAATF
jgi:hypothetical protein